MALTVATWFWGEKYSLDYVRKLAAGLKRNLRQPYRFMVMSDRDIDIAGVLSYEIPHSDRYLLDVKGCFARLRMFDPVWQRLAQVHDRLVCIDLDAIITGPLDPLFDRVEPFLILQGANASNPCPHNGSLWSLLPSYRPDVWSDFSLDAASRITKFDFADDQGWFAHKLLDAAGWKAGSSSGVYAFQKPGWPKGEALPTDARMVAFPGWRDPSKFMHLPWVKEHWCD